MNKELSKEILQIKKDAEKYANNKTMKLLRAYKKVLDSVQAQLAEIYMQYTVDNQLKIGKQQRYTVLTQLQKQLIDQAKELGQIDVGVTTNILTDVFSDTYYKTAYTIDKGVSVAVKFDILRPEFVKAAVNMPIEGKMFSDRIWDNKEKLVNRLTRDINRAMTEGKSPEKLAREVKNDFGVSAYESKRLVNTEVARCQSIAQDEIYKESGIVKQVMWSATLDMDTNPEDAELDGRVWDIGEDHPTPPLHPNCRCALIPVVSGWSPSSRRENIRDGSGKKQIIDYSDYNSWANYRGIE